MIKQFISVDNKRLRLMFTQKLTNHIICLMSCYMLFDYLYLCLNSHLEKKYLQF
jgi:hypothetical protein